MQREVKSLGKILRAEALDEAWTGVIEIARRLGVAAVIKTRYRDDSSDGGSKAVRMEISRLYMSPSLSSRPTGTSARADGPAAALWHIASTNGDAIEPPRDTQGLPTSVRDPHQALDPFVERFVATLRQHHGIQFESILTVPVSSTGDRVLAEFLNFFAKGSLGAEAISLLGTATGAYAGKAAVLAAKEGNDPAVALRPQEIECIRWAVAGKSLQDIADITGYSYRSVRYHIDQARERYGYTTNLQAFVRAAIDYGFDPLSSPPHAAAAT